MKIESKSGDRKKLVLIPVLVLVLAYVLSGGDGGPSEVPELANGGTTSGKKKASVVVRRSPRWPTASVQSIVEHDPFQLKDPRAMLDAAFDEYQLRAEPAMTEILPNEFFAHEVAIREAGKQIVDAAFQSLLASVESLAREPEAAPPQLVAERQPSEIEQAIEIPQETDNEAQQEQAEQVAHLQARLSELKSRRITMVLESEFGRSAILDEQKITEGELIEEGIRVASISPDGVVFKIDHSLLETSSTDESHQNRN